MADVSGITAVRPTTNTIVDRVTYGATVAAGSTVYFDSANNEYPLADCDATVLTAATKGIAVTPGVDGGQGYIAKGGSIVLVGATLVVGETYIQSDTAGGLKPIGDKASGDFVTIIGTASTTTQIDLAINATGTQAP
jgi:hypothetical protein